MKNFNELSKLELSVLSDVQVDAYIDLELANQGVVKGIETNISFPDYLKPITVEPERDCIVYEVGDYNFLDKESAEKFVSLVGGLQQVTVTYDYGVGSDFYYASNTKIVTPSIKIKRVYSTPKYEAIKNQLKLIKLEKERNNKKNNEDLEGAINYEAIDNIKEQIRSKVRDSITFFEQAKKYSSNYSKYFTITEDKEKAISTIFTVFNIQDEEMKNQIKENVENLKNTDLN
jgi:hypothetical protein